MSRVRVKWQKNEFVLQTDLNSPVFSLKEQLRSHTGVLPEKQKLLLKGKVLKNEMSLAEAGVADNTLLMMMGTPTELVEPEAQIKFKEDLTHQELAALYKEKEGIPLPAGLVNLGNTCYMNSTIQVMRRVHEYSDALKEYPLQNPNDREEKFTHELGNLFKGLETSGTSLTPFVFVNMLREIFPMFNETDERGIYKQQDAEECWGVIMENVKHRLFSQQGESLVENLFNIELRNTMECQEAQEPLDMSLESAIKLYCIIDNQGNPVNHLMEGIKAGLEGNIEKHSESLGRNAIYKKTQQISKLPGYLCIQMVRFIWKQASSAAGTKAVKAKILRSVTFPKILDVYELCTPELQRELDVGRDMEKQIRERELEESKEKPKDYRRLDAEFGTGLETGAYQLVGVVTHKGRTGDSGHYLGWTHVRDDDWVKYDDDVVSQVSTDEILNLKGGGDWHMAFILVYRKLQIVPEES